MDWGIYSLREFGFEFGNEGFYHVGSADVFLDGEAGEGVVDLRGVLQIFYGGAQVGLADVCHGVRIYRSLGSVPCLSIRGI